MSHASPFRFFDVHSHIQDPRFDADRREVIARMAEANVGTIVVGTDMESSRAAADIARSVSSAWAAAGLHPTDNAGERFDAERYRALLRMPRVVAVGECGLDYVVGGEKDTAEKKRQKELFEAHIALAAEENKPLMVHCRGAHEDAIDILRAGKRTYGDRLRGNIHFFSAGADIAKRYIEMDFSMSFTGVVTFARDYDEVVGYIPREFLLSETDCPYVAPVPHRGTRNEPSFVPLVVSKMAEIRGEDPEIFARTLAENAVRIFGLAGGGAIDNRA